MNIRGIVSWNGFYYGVSGYKRPRYYKARTARFDDSFGGTERVTAEEYREVVEKYNARMGW